MPWKLCSEAVLARRQPQRLSDLCGEVQTAMQQMNLSSTHYNKAVKLVANTI